MEKHSNEKVMSAGNERACRWRKLIADLLPCTLGYHNHKETMAHACVVLELLILGWTVTERGEEVLSSSWGLWIVVVIWLLIHIYMRWELRYRRWAAIQVNAMQATLQRWALKRPEPDEFLPNPDLAPAPCCLWVLLDFFVPCFKGTKVNKRLGENLAKGFAEELALAERDTWGLYGVEWIVTAASFLILGAIVVLRGALDC